MTEDSDFSLISVDADDEDDIVIQAGVPKGAAGQTDASGKAAQSAAPAAPKAAAAAEAAGDDRPVSAEEAARQRALKKHKAEQEMNRMVTTEEDLNAPVPFAHMQRTILIVLAIAAVLALIYFFAVYHPVG